MARCCSAVHPLARRVQEAMQAGQIPWADVAPPCSPARRPIDTSGSYAGALPLDPSTVFWLETKFQGDCFRFDGTTEIPDRPGVAVVQVAAQLEMHAGLSSVPR